MASACVDVATFTNKGLGDHEISIFYIWPMGNEATMSADTTSISTTWTMLATQPVTPLAGAAKRHDETSKS